MNIKEMEKNYDEQCESVKEEILKDPLDYLERMKSIVSKSPKILENSLYQYAIGYANLVLAVRSIRENEDENIPQEILTYIRESLIHFKRAMELDRQLEEKLLGNTSDIGREMDAVCAILEEEIPGEVSRIWGVIKLSYLNRVSYNEELIEQEEAKEIMEIPFKVTFVPKSAYVLAKVEENGEEKIITWFSDNINYFKNRAKIGELVGNVWFIKNCEGNWQVHEVVKTK